MSAGFAFYPAAKTIGLETAGAPKTVRLTCLSGDIAPASNSSCDYGFGTDQANGCSFGDPPQPGTGSGMKTPNLRVDNQSNCSVSIPAIGLTVAGGASYVSVRPFSTLDADYAITAALQAWTIATYNGVSGQNPRGFYFDVVVTPHATNPASGTIIICAGVPEYGTFWNSFPANAPAGNPQRHVLTVTAGNEGDLRDSFDGPDEQLVNHTPEFAPVAPAGEEDSWHGTGAFSHNISSNRLLAGGNSGGMKYGRIWAGRRDSFTLFGDFERQVDNGTDGDILALIARCSKVLGNSDAALDFVQFYAEKYTNDTVRFNAASIVNLVVQDRLDNFATRTWNRQTKKRMWMRLSGSDLLMYLSDVGGTENIELLGTLAMPIAPLNDDNHKYAGFGMTFLSDCGALELLQAKQISLLAAPLVVVVTGTNPGYVAIDADELGFPLSDLEASVVYDGAASGWLTTEFEAADTPTRLVLTPDPAGLAANTLYTATVTVTANDDAAASVAIRVVFITSFTIRGNVGAQPRKTLDAQGAATAILSQPGEAWVTAALVGGNVRVDVDATEQTPQQLSTELTVTLDP